MTITTQLLPLVLLLSFVFITQCQSTPGVCNNDQCCALEYLQYQQCKEFISAIRTCGTTTCSQCATTTNQAPPTPNYFPQYVNRIFYYNYPDYYSAINTNCIRIFDQYQCYDGAIQIGSTTTVERFNIPVRQLMLEMSAGANCGSSGSDSNLIIIIACSVGGFVALVVVVLVICIRRRKQKEHKVHVSNTADQPV